MPTDDQLFAAVRALGCQMAELFLVDGRVYRSADAGDFQAGFTYSLMRGIGAEHEAGLVSLLRRLSRPEYGTLAALDDEIAQVQEWYNLFDALSELLSAKAGVALYLVDDYYACPQHKVECMSREALTPELVAATQALLSRYERPWEVIFALPSSSPEGEAYCVRATSCAQRAG
jgi:hypothetical protein